jgi:aspartate carbamoyltransferase catalytic subunit
MIKLSAFKGRDILSMLDFTRKDIEYIFKIAEKMEPIAFNRKRTDLLKDYVMATLFFEPSTRTRLSFETAMLRLGGGVTGWASPEVSRTAIETIPDTAKVIEGYVDVVVMRHKENGAPALYAKNSAVPVISGGDGTNEHPTQALLDLYTIEREKGSIDEVKVLLMGNMDQRAMHSLPFALAKFDDTEVFILAPDDKDRQMPKWAIDKFDKLGLKYSNVQNVEEVIEEVDVIYPIYAKPYTEEGFMKPVEDRFKITKEKLKNAKKDLLVMHALPRIDELSTDVDDTPHAKYFKQSGYGIPVRMALLALVLGKA